MRAAGPVRGSGVWLAAGIWVLVVSWAVLGAQVPSAGPRPAATAGPSLLSHSEDCQACHNNLVSPAGEDVSIGVAWRATMMANSARDPYWQAAVRRETIDHPSHADDIQDECGGCHMPISTQAARAVSAKGAVFAHLPVAAAGGEPLARLAADGVSCTVCHQIAPEGLGTRERFNGHFLVTPPSPGGTRRIYGPYEIDAGRRTIMRSVTGYEQEQAPHIRESELCASCHTLITTAWGPNGEVVGTLPEQMNYQEWRHSAFPAEQRSCQSCHMPRAAGPVRLSSVLGDERDTLARHSFIGGNAHMLRILNRYRGELGVTAQPQELEAAAGATVRQLQQQTAELSLSAPRVSGGRLVFEVAVRNLTGHKFPTGYPSRRTWLHVRVMDERGQPVFESGAPRGDGAIVDNDSDADGGSFEPHYDVVTRPDQVQIYEPILGDRAGVPTTGLLTATQYLKDNRLLPRGFDKRTADAEIAVYGAAVDDANFTGEGDRVRYEIGASGGQAFRVEVELLYQSIAYRWARSLERYDAAEPRRFGRYYRETAAGSAVLVTRAVSQSNP